MAAPTMLLNDGNRIPQIGLGTWPLDDAAVASVIVTAIEAGYQHIDTVARYGWCYRAASIRRSDRDMSRRMPSRASNFRA
jgi:diketogulonate reductase-like aldo/keto reductase